MKSALASLLIAACAGVLLGGLGAWVAKGWQSKAELASVHRGYAETLQDIAEKTSRAHEAARAVSAKFTTAVSALDAAATERIADDKEETDRLRACVRDGTCGVRIITKTIRVGGGDVPSAAAACSLGDAAERLDEDVSSRVLDHRESIQRDAAKLEYLQGYAEQCGRLGAEASQGVTE